jgi:hypothetical protein
VFVSGPLRSLRIVAQSRVNYFHCWRRELSRNVKIAHSRCSHAFSLIHGLFLTSWNFGVIPSWHPNCRLKEVRGGFVAYPASLGPEEQLHSLFQPDVLLPKQSLAVYRRMARLDPEKKLMLAVLQDAVECFQKYVRAQDRIGKTRFREVEDWIMEEDSDEVFSFENICETAGIDPSYLRQGLLRWKKRMRAGGLGARSVKQTRSKNKSEASKLRQQQWEK